MFWCSLVGVDCPPKEAMPVAIACLEQEDLGFGVLCWEREVIRAEKIVDGRVPLPARSGYISENQGCCCCFSHSAHWIYILNIYIIYIFANPKKLLYTVANPARGLLNREKKKKKKSGSAPPPPPRAARSEKKKKKNHATHPHV